MALIEAKRFRVKDANDNYIREKFDTLQECVDWLNEKTKSGRELDNPFYFNVEDIVDDIWVSADDVVQAFADGERCEDLQAF